MSLRSEFVSLARGESSNVSMLCERFGISRKTGHKWLGRYRSEGRDGLTDRSRRPNCSPNVTSVDVEQAVLEVRRKHPAWGGRKIRIRLLKMGYHCVPAASTVTAILRRHGLLLEAESVKHRAFERFERPSPNDLWQMDFKGHFGLSNGSRCHPLTVLDDHWRYAIGVRACANERTGKVQSHLRDLFRCYGVPRAMLMDNGSPWGSDEAHPYTVLTVWLIHLGVSVLHSGAYHPQTQGKDERFHRTLKAEVLRYREFRDVADTQEGFDRWRVVYNEERPHEALGMCVPAMRYQPSHRSYPEKLPRIEYGPGDVVRKVQAQGKIHFRGRVFKVSKGFRGYSVALRPTREDGVLSVYFCQQEIGQVDLRCEREDVEPLVGGQASVRYAHSGLATNQLAAPCVKE